MYKVRVNKQILKSLDKIPIYYLLRIKEAVNHLAENPRPFGSVKLADSENAYRIRVGVYRIIYSIADDVLIVEIVKIDHRRSVYK
ncbi:MAG: type II toxin-antitoxin system RelE/ParE family toxin [Prevotellaceae bacterium]|jgi:mRNA interferase RelE/StbE|nr:type II toxin-antitoxin system RelE/ParE family toxin [Prevotellaceae bacterium]